MLVEPLLHSAASGAAALALAAKHPPDLVLLDLGLPDMDGVDVIAGLRGWTDAPIIVLSGRTGVPTRSMPWMPVPMTT